MAKKKAVKKNLKTVKKAVKKTLKTATKTVKKTKQSTTSVIVKYDCGFNNHLTIRGEGAGLNWGHGTPLKNVGSDEWVFSVICNDPHFEFKVLINDQVYELGDNHKIKNGDKQIIHPKFH